MDAEAGNRRTAGARRQGAILGIHFVPHSRDAHAGARPRRHAPRDRGAVEFGKQRFVAPQGVRLVRIPLRTQAAFLNEPCDTAMYALRYTGNFLISRRGDAPEHWFALAVNHIDTIHCQDMKMGIEIQGITEALNESYGAAASLAVRGRNVRPAADRGKNGAHKSAIYP